RLGGHGRGQGEPERDELGGRYAEGRGQRRDDRLRATLGAHRVSGFARSRGARGATFPRRPAKTAGRLSPGAAAPHRSLTVSPGPPAHAAPEAPPSLAAPPTPPGDSVPAPPRRIARPTGYQALPPGAAPA